MADARIEALILACMDDARPLVTTLRGRGWPVEVHVEHVELTGTYRLDVRVTVFPATMERPS